MLTFNRILLASDFSASAEAALCYAAALARQSHASLVVLHVVETTVAALPHWTDIFRSTEAFAAIESADAEALQRLLAHSALADLTLETVVKHGAPAEHIIDMSPYVDLIVMGTRGVGAARGKSTRNVARQVAHGSSVPVLLVPEDGGVAHLPAVSAQALTFQHILLALHFAQYAPEAIALSHELAKTGNATLRVLQVLEPDKAPAYPLAAGAGLYHNIDGIKVLLQKRLAEIVPDDPTGPALERLVLEGNAGELIQRQSATFQADLIVMSAHAYGAVKKFFTLSTVDAILDRTPCPLLAVPIPRSTFPFTTAPTRGNGAGHAD